MQETKVDSSVELLLRAKAGDDEALNGLLTRYLPRLQRWARRRLPWGLRTMLETADLVQDAVINTLPHLESLEIRSERAFEYYLKQATKTTTAVVRELRHRVNVNTLEHEKADRLALNEIARVVVDLDQPVAFDPYRKNRATGAFVIIDRLSNRTVGAGMILDRAEPGAGSVGAGAMLDALESAIRAGKDAQEQLRLLGELRKVLGQ